MTKKKDKTTTAKIGQTVPRWKPGQPMQEADDPIYNLGFVIQPMSSGRFSKNTQKENQEESSHDKE